MLEVWDRATRERGGNRVKMVWIISAGRDSKDGAFFDCIIFENEINPCEWEWLMT